MPVLLPDDSLLTINYCIVGPSFRYMYGMCVQQKVAIMFILQKWPSQTPFVFFLQR